MWNPLVCSFQLQQFYHTILEKMNGSVLEVNLVQDVHIASVLERSCPYEKEHSNITVQLYKVCLHPGFCLSMMHISVSSLIWQWFQFPITLWCWCWVLKSSPVYKILEVPYQTTIYLYSKRIGGQLHAVVLVPIGTTIGQSVQQSTNIWLSNVLGRSLLLPLGRVWPGWA